MRRHDGTCDGLRPFSGGDMRSVVSGRRHTWDDAGVKMPEIAGNGDSSEGCNRASIRKKRSRLQTDQRAGPGRAESPRVGYKSDRLGLRPKGTQDAAARRISGGFGGKPTPGEGTELHFIPDVVGTTCEP